ISAVGFDCLAEEGVVASEGLAHRLWVLLPEAGAALNVGEKEGDRARRQFCHVAASMRAEVGETPDCSAPKAVISCVIAIPLPSHPPSIYGGAHTLQNATPVVNDGIDTGAWQPPAYSGTDR